MAEIVVADAGPLIAFGRLDKLALLGTIFDRVIGIAPPSSGRLDLRADIELGEGEASAIALAAELKCGVLIDDLQGRTAAALLNLKVIGTVGVLVLARERGSIPLLAPLLQDLSASGYYLSESLIEGALRRVGER